MRAKLLLNRVFPWVPSRDMTALTTLSNISGHTGNGGRAPLSHGSAKKGHMGVVKTPVGWGEVNPHKSYKYSPMPLSMPLRNGMREWWGVLSDPNLPVRRAFGIAGLTRDFSTMPGRTVGKRLSQTKAGPGLGHLQASGISTPTLIPEMAPPRY